MMIIYHDDNSTQCNKVHDTRRISCTQQRISRGRVSSGIVHNTPRGRVSSGSVRKSHTLLHNGINLTKVLLLIIRILLNKINEIILY